MSDSEAEAATVSKLFSPEDVVKLNATISFAINHEMNYNGRENGWYGLWTAFHHILATQINLPRVIVTTFPQYQVFYSKKQAEDDWKEHLEEAAKAKPRSFATDRTDDTQKHHMSKQQEGFINAWLNSLNQHESGMEVLHSTSAWKKALRTPTLYVVPDHGTVALLLQDPPMELNSGETPPPTAEIVKPTNTGSDVHGKINVVVSESKPLPADPNNFQAFGEKLDIKADGARAEVVKQAIYALNDLKWQKKILAVITVGQYWSWTPIHESEAVQKLSGDVTKMDDESLSAFAGTLPWSTFCKVTDPESLHEEVPEFFAAAQLLVEKLEPLARSYYEELHFRNRSRSSAAAPEQRPAASNRGTASPDQEHAAPMTPPRTHGEKRYRSSPESTSRTDDSPGSTTGRRPQRKRGRSSALDNIQGPAFPTLAQVIAEELEEDDPEDEPPRRGSVYRRRQIISSDEESDPEGTNGSPSAPEYDDHDFDLGAEHSSQPEHGRDELARRVGDLGLKSRSTSRARLSRDISPDEGGSTPKHGLTLSRSQGSSKDESYSDEIEPVVIRSRSGAPSPPSNIGEGSEMRSEDDDDELEYKSSTEDDNESSTEDDDDKSGDYEARSSVGSGSS
ncbi:hypothetical protein FISHEDRAFT_55988 [Fistulina hepatica ATCC 64428]|uniref:Uncharacterized protein n=1 Tax=Fistulina hepatica ATCC 64428 TaxID=1128425 RepID=A0A0D7ALN2_9AGAR|nr:hypothetical protein FISHEDRAFT_55988 [Fistulina hepatica ATCC 64428]